MVSATSATPTTPTTPKFDDLSDLEIEIECDASNLDSDFEIEITVDSDTKKSKQPRRVTDEIVKKIKELLPQIKEKTKTKTQVAKECNLHINTVTTIIEKLERNEDPVQRKPSQKINPEIIAKIKELLPRIKAKELSQKTVAAECKISPDTLRQVIKKLEKGEDAAQRKPDQKVTAAIVKKVKTLMPQIEDGSLSYTKAGEQCELGRKVVKAIVEKLKQKRDPTQRESKKITPELIEKVRRFLPQIKDNSLTCAKVAEKCQICVASLKKIVQIIEKPAEEKKPQNVNTAMIEKINGLRPEIRSGKLCYAEVAELLEIYEETVKKIVKKLDENDAAEKKKAKPQKADKVSMQSKK